MYKWLLFPIALTGVVFANPQDPSVIAGEAHFAHGNRALHITTGDRAIINWKNFSIEAGELAKFLQPSKHSAVLNRVTGTDISSLMGTLEANGKVYLVNPHGIIIGPKGIVNAASFVGSTLDVLNDDFLMNRELLFHGGSKASIINYGTIHAWDGPVALIGFHIDNTGEIQAPEVALAVGQEVLLKPDGDVFIRPTFTGDIAAALEKEGNPYLLGINHKGKIDAIKVSKKDGRVFLEGKNIEVSGEIVAREGKVDILGENIIFTPSSHIETSAGENGNGGDVVAIAENVGVFYGKIAARGGEESGDGGFVELSGKKYLDFRAEVDRLAPKGQAGMLLLDPSDIDIDFNMGMNSANVFFGVPFCLAMNYCITAAVPNPAIIDNGVLGAALAGGPITVTTASGFPPMGKLRILDVVSWSSIHSLTLISNENIEVDASVHNIPAGLDATGTGGITLTVGTDLILTGGTVANAAAFISSDLGTISVTAVDNVTLTGGSAVQTYAQIGRGLVGAQTTVTAPISLPTINGSILLQGGTGLEAYAQIGHSPFPGASPITVGGDVTVITDGFFISTTTLKGGLGPGTSSTAIIGHGNELSIFVQDCSGNITVHSKQDLMLNGGSASLNHAIIGFHSPTSGAMADFTTISNPILPSNSVEVAIAILPGDITLNAGPGNNAVIGYYNANVASGNPNVQINGFANAISVTTLAFDQVILNAGSTGGINAGAAVIGTFVNNTPANNAQSVVNILCDGLTLNGPTAGNDGSALVVNNDFLTPVTTFIDNVNISMITLLSDAVLNGGAGVAPGLAQIYASNNLNTAITGDLKVNNIGESRPAIVKAGTNANINTMVLGGTASVVGGNNPAAEARIECVNGPVNIGTILVPTFTNVQVGDPGGMSQAPSLITANTGVIIDVFSSISLQGGMGVFVPSPSATIQSVGGLTDILANNLSLRGGTGPLAYAEISSIGGTMIFTIIGPVLLQGGSATEAYAQIGKGFLSAVTPLISSEILWIGLTGNLTMNGGMGVGAYAQIGHAPFGLLTPTDVAADVNFQTGVGGAILLTGGSATNATAIIGHGNELSTFLRDCSGSIITGALGGYTLMGGTVPQTHAIIGFCSPTAGSMGPLNVNSPGVNVEFQNNPMSLIATNGSNAVIGYYNPTTAAGVSVFIQDVAVFSMTNQTLSLFPGNDGGTGAGDAVIGTFVNPGSVAQSNVNVNAGDLNLFGPTGANDGRAMILNSGPNGAINVLATGNIFMARDSLMFNQSPDPLLAIANFDILMTQNAAVLTTLGSLTLVVDNAFPVSPGVGNGKIVKEIGATIGSLSGPVRIFTARQPLNQIQGSINGVIYVPGPQFVNTPLEQWATYYPSSFNGFPFTIFYKDPTAVPPGELESTMVAFAELLYDLKTYDELFFYPWNIRITYDRTRFHDMNQPEGGLSSFEVINDQDHNMLRRLYREYHLKKIDTLK